MERIISLHVCKPVLEIPDYRAGAQAPIVSGSSVHPRLDSSKAVRAMSIRYDARYDLRDTGRWHPAYFELHHRDVPHWCAPLRPANLALTVCDVGIAMMVGSMLSQPPQDLTRISQALSTPANAI